MESNPKLNPAIKILVEYLAQLKTIDEFCSIQEKANHIGKMNQIDTAIQQIQLCEKNGILGGSIINKLPNSTDIHFQYVIAHENESSNPEDWEEVLFKGRQIRLNGGDLVVR